MPQLVEVKVSVYVRVPKSRKADKTLADMEVEGRASRLVRSALDLSQFANRMASARVEVTGWEITDAIVED